MDITKATVRQDPKAQELCRLGFETYNLLMRKGNKERKRGNTQKGRELHWKAGNELETTIGWMLGLRARHNSENTWKWAGESEETKADWDFTNNELRQRVDIKACKAHKYGNNIFIEESSKGVPSGWTRDKKEGDYLLYVDTDTGKGYLIQTQKLLGVCQRAGRSKSGGDDDGARGYVVHLSQLSEWELIHNTFLFPVYPSEDHL